MLCVDYGMPKFRRKTILLFADHTAGEGQSDGILARTMQAGKGMVPCEPTSGPRTVVRKNGCFRYGLFLYILLM